MFTISKSILAISNSLFKISEPVSDSNSEPKLDSKSTSGRLYPGIQFGQCSETCGANHRHISINGDIFLIYKLFRGRPLIQSPKIVELPDGSIQIIFVAPQRF